jgi:hypothetical protein
VCCLSTACDGLTYKASAEDLLRKFLQKSFRIQPNATLSTKQFNYSRKRKAARSLFRDADIDQNEVLSQFEMEEYAISLFERDYMSEECSLWLMDTCFQSHKETINLRAFRDCFGVATRPGAEN